MARTKPSARKSTGGNSTNRPLGPPEHVPAIPQLPFLESPPFQPPSPLTELPPSSPCPPVPAVPVRVVSKTEGKIGDGSSSQPRGSWCALCSGRGGQLLVECGKCRRGNCTTCIPDLAKIDRKTLERLEYRCPPCHGRRQLFYGLWQGDQPFFPNGMEIAETATGGHGARTNCSPLVIVEFIMSSLAKDGTPAKVLYSYLQGHFTQNIRKLKFIRFKFNLDPDNLELHEQNLSKLVQSLNALDFGQIILFVQTHSDKDRGDLMYSGDGCSPDSRSTGVSNFFDVVIGPELRAFIFGRSYSLMVLAACGSVVELPDPLQELQEVANKFQFSDVFAFSEANLDPGRISPFINEFSTEVLITGRKSCDALPTALSSSSTLKHTGIVHFGQSEAGLRIQRFERFHPTSRPNGTRFPMQCPRCKVYYPWVVPAASKKKLNEDQSFKCISKKCPGVFKVRRLKGYRAMPKDLAAVYSTTI